MVFGEVYELWAPRDDRGQRRIYGDRFGIIVRDLSSAASDPLPFVLALPTSTGSGQVQKLMGTPYTFPIQPSTASGIIAPCVALVHQVAAYGMESFGRRKGMLEDRYHGYLKKHIRALFSNILDAAQ